VSSKGLADLLSAASAMGLPQPWALFFAAVAHHESRWNSAVGRGIEIGAPPGVKINHSTGEAAAAAVAYQRNEHLFSECGHPKSHYLFGSGGWFGMLPGNGLYAFRGTPSICLSPWAVFHPHASIAMAIGYAQRLMRYDAFEADRSWINLNRGWAAPSKMGASWPDIDGRFAAALRAVADATGEHLGGPVLPLTGTPYDYFAGWEASA
jgi:hypothetical protein